MIVPSMTDEEIYKELYEDLKSIDSKIRSSHEDFRKKAVRVSRYPFSRTYEVVSRKNNLFILTFKAGKRSHWRNTPLQFCCIYDRPEGTYVAELYIKTNRMGLFPPHFFKRYRERVVKDEAISTIDLIKHYFRNDWGFVEAILQKDILSVYHYFENEPINFAGVCSQGYCFGERQGNIYIIKTIISEDMLFDNQKSSFAEMKRGFVTVKKEEYGVDLSKSHL